MKSSFLTRDQTLGLWSGSTDSKTLGYQRTNPREYQIVRTHTEETLEYKIWHYPTTSSTLCKMPHLNNKQNKNTNPIISRQDYHLTHHCPPEEKQTNKNSAQVSPYTKLTQTTGPTLEGRNQKEQRIQPSSRNEFNFSCSLGKGDLKHNKLKNNEKAEKYCTNEGTN